MYPVDLPAVDDTDLTLSSEQYFSCLESQLHKMEEFQSSMTKKVSTSYVFCPVCNISLKYSHLARSKNGTSLFPQTAVTLNNVKRLQLFEDGRADCTLLALHPPDVPTQGWERDVLSLVPSDMGKAMNNVMFFTIQFWPYTCMRSGGVWMTYYERRPNPELACYW